MQITNKIHFRNLHGDIFGGITTAVVSLLLALAFGVASGAGAVSGLYGAVCVGFFAALFGGTPTLISEPTGPMTVVITTIIASLTASNPENGLAMAFTVVMLAGIFQFLFGVFRLGKYITLMPYSVISGFMSGIGVILIILQIAPFLGQKAPKGGVLGTITNLPNLLTNINPAAAILGALTLAIIFLMPAKLKRIAPPQLVALIVGTIVSLVFFPNVNIPRIGEIPMGLPTLQMPTFTPGQTTVMLVDGLMLGLLGCIDTLLTAVIADSLTRTEDNYNKELMGQGIGNKAIARQHNAVRDCDAAVMDLSDVPHMGVTASLEIENAIRDAVDKGRQVYIVGAADKVKRRLEKLGIFPIVPSHNLFNNRTEALRQAVTVANSYTNPQMAVSDDDLSSAVQA